MTSITVKNARISLAIYWLYDNLDLTDYSYELGTIANSSKVTFSFKNDAHAAVFKLTFCGWPHYAR